MVRGLMQLHRLKAGPDSSSMSHSLLNLLPLSYAAFSYLNALAHKKHIPRATLSFFRTYQLSINKHSSKKNRQSRNAVNINITQMMVGKQRVKR